MTLKEIDAQAKYKRNRLWHLLVTSKVWLLEYEKYTKPCMLCPLNKRICTRTIISGSHTDGEPVSICHKCVGKLQLERDRKEQAKSK